MERTVNERPNDFYTYYGADIDISSAYGSQLKNLYFQIGRPRLFAKPNTTFQQKMTLGKFMEKNFEKMTKYKLFKVVVSGKLSFEQDLIFSRVSSKRVSEKKIQEFSLLGIEKRIIPGEFVLLRKEIINGVI